MSEEATKKVLKYFAILGVTGCVIWIWRDPKQAEPYVALLGAIAGLVSVFMPVGDVSIAVRFLTSPSKKGYWIIENLGGAVAFDVGLEITTVPNIANFYITKDWSPYDQAVHLQLFPIATLGSGEHQLLPLQPGLDWPQDGHLFDILIKWRATPKGPVKVRIRRLAYYSINK
jgi:hypothetical protein